MDRVASFADLAEKARWLDAAASIDATGQRIRDFARRFVRAYPERGELGTRRPEALGHRAAAIHAFVRDSIAYRQDRPPRLGVRAEEFEDSETILARGFDDCDGKSRLFVALCRAAGVEARIRPVFASPRSFVHVQALVRFPGSMHWHGHDAHGWLLAEMILRGADLGDNPDDLPRGAKGERVLAGPKR